MIRKTMKKRKLNIIIPLIIGTIVITSTLTVSYSPPPTISNKKINSTNILPSPNKGILPEEEWNKTFGGSNIDVGLSGQQTSDGGYIISGYTRSYGNPSGRNIWLIKTDISGTEEWNKTFGGNDDEEGHSVQQTTDGGYIITGYTKSFGAGLEDAFLLKTDADGNEEWNKTFGGSNDDQGTQVQQTNDGGYIIVGFTWSFATGGADVWLIKTDSSGNQEWTKSIGGLASDGAWSIQQTIDGGYIITGWTFSYGPDPGIYGNLWLIKTDSQGNEIWNEAFGGTDADRGYYVQQTIDTGYIMTGYTGSFGAGLYDVWLLKTDSSGIEEWNKTFGGTGRDYGNCVQQTNDGGYILTGYTLSYGAGGDDVWVIKTDENGNETYNKTYGGASSDIGYTIRQTTDTGYIVTGHTLSYGAGVHDVWLIKIEGNTSENTVTINLYQDWNLVTVPLDNGWTAETLGQNIDGCSVVSMFEGSTQTFVSHVVGSPHDDFSIVDGVGYFIYLGHDSYLNMTNLPITTVNVPIYTGWDLIGWYHDSATTAESLGNHILDCSVISMFNGSTQTFASHVIGSPHDNFPVTQGMGLFIYATSESTWTGQG